jgi:hypothetical protein
MEFDFLKLLMYMRKAELLSKIPSTHVWLIEGQVESILSPLNSSRLQGAFLVAAANAEYRLTWLSKGTKDGGPINSP